jgi:hypothetical protein
LRELTIGGGHVSGQLGAHHFGLGSAPSAEIRVTWPDGEVGPWQEVEANSFAVVDRASAEIERWAPDAAGGG